MRFYTLYVFPYETRVNDINQKMQIYFLVNGSNCLKWLPGALHGPQWSDNVALGAEQERAVGDGPRSNEESRLRVLRDQEKLNTEVTEEMHDAGRRFGLLFRRVIQESRYVLLQLVE